MSGLDPDRAAAALGPVRAELLRRANADAEKVIAAAQSDAQRVVEEATRTANQMLDRARAAGKAAGARLAANEEVALRRGLRRDVLAARDGAYRLWRQRAGEAVLALRDDPRYPQWRAALVDIAHATLGDDAQVTEDATGGVHAEKDSRRIDLSLSAIATRTVDEAAAEAESLWS
ncbi:hypothetical protein JDV09_03020 [Mycobacterium sp. Y57]|uniref:hypothetical protein n=1 Tax=Mycolicibacterium xanthum TaxID=2796469 RepID=UPI001C844B93|nr:hypothetical protein [Mycolicibacterium xanthum]MBX7431085.1 hypothetical protein [Mycolicibacterium xanthum]